MFEKVNSLFPAEGRDSGALPHRARRDDAYGDGQGVSGNRDNGDHGDRAGNALRAIEWSELNARLDAARDLRLLLRRDSIQNIEANAASFGDAAARYFAALEHEERPVNPDGLEARKASGGNLRPQNEDAARGDARDD